MPRPLITISRPSLIIRAAVGYQPVGTKPRTLLVSSAISTTAITLVSEQTTNKRDWSEFKLNPEGVMPAGCLAVIATLIDSIIFKSLLSDTPTEKTVLVFAAATKSRAAHCA